MGLIKIRPDPMTDFSNLGTLETVLLINSNDRELEIHRNSSKPPASCNFGNWLSSYSLNSDAVQSISGMTTFFSLSPASTNFSLNFGSIDLQVILVDAL